MVTGAAGRGGATGRVKMQETPSPRLRADLAYPIFTLLSNRLCTESAGGERIFPEVILFCSIIPCVRPAVEVDQN